MMEKEKIICPYCGYRMPIFVGKGAESHGIYCECKGRNCKERFEIIVKKGEQIK